MKMPLYNLPGFLFGYNGKPMARAKLKRNRQYVDQYEPDVIDSKYPSGTNSGYGALNNRSKFNIEKYAQYGDIATGAISFAGDAINSFGPVKRENEILSDSGVSNANSSGFGYMYQNSVNNQLQLGELNRLNTNNTLKVAGSGAALGTAIAPGIGTLIGGAIGALTGIFGGASRKRKLRKRLFNAQQEADRYNNFALSSAQSDYMNLMYDNSHENTQDDILYAKNGKDLNMMLPKFKNGKASYTSLGKQNVMPNAKVAAAESIIDNIDDTSNTTGYVVKDGKLDLDTNFANVNDGTIILGSDIDWRTGVNFRDLAIPYTSALEKINKKYELRTSSKLNKLRGNIGKESDRIQQAEVNKLKQPIVSKLKDLSEQLRFLHELTKVNMYNNYKRGKESGINRAGWLSNAIPMGIGMITSLGQYFDAKRQDIHTPDVYAANQYENAALSKLASIKSNPYNIIREISDADRRNRYAINRSGGISGALKYLANVTSGLLTQANISDALFKSQEQNNQYLSQYANALLQSGNNNAQHRQSANQYNTEYAASSHAAKLQGMQMGIRNFMDYIQQYAANEYKRRTGNAMLDLYQQKVDLDRYNLENNLKKNINTKTTNNSKSYVNTYTPVNFESKPKDIDHSKPFTEWNWTTNTINKNVLPWTMDYRNFAPEQGYIDNKGVFRAPWYKYAK